MSSRAPLHERSESDRSEIHFGIRGRLDPATGEFMPALTMDSVALMKTIVRDTDAFWAPGGPPRRRARRRGARGAAGGGALGEDGVRDHSGCVTAPSLRPWRRSSRSCARSRGRCPRRRGGRAAGEGVAGGDRGRDIDRKAPTACDTGIGACCAFFMLPYLGGFESGAEREVVVRFRGASARLARERWPERAREDAGCSVAVAMKVTPGNYLYVPLAVQEQRRSSAPTASGRSPCATHGNSTRPNRECGGAGVPRAGVWGVCLRP